MCLYKKTAANKNLHGLNLPICQGKHPTNMVMIAMDQAQRHRTILPLAFFSRRLTFEEGGTEKNISKGINFLVI